MAFGHTVSLCDDIQDLSEWSESIDLNELSQQIEVVEEPSAKRPRTEIDEDLEISNQTQDEPILRPAWFDCHGDQNNIGSEIREAICTEGFLKSGEFNALLHHEDPYPAIYTTSTIQFFDCKFLTASSLVYNMENLFFLLRQQVFKLENDANMALLTDDGDSRSVEGRKKCRQFMAYILHYIHWHVDSTVVQDGNWSNPVLAPSVLRAELDELLLFIGRLSALPAEHIRTKWTSSVGSVRLTPGRHLFHLQMELNWGVIQATCKLLERENQLNGQSSTHCVDTINSIEKATISLVWDLTAIAASIYDKANQADVMKVSPFLCGCVCELWIMLIHLMDHLSTKTHLQSFWSAVSSIMSEILHPREMECDIQEGSVESLAPPGFTVGTPVNFCWWLLTHLSPLYWFTDRGVYSHRKKPTSLSYGALPGTVHQAGHKGCVPGNWVQVQGLLKQSLDGIKETHGDLNRRFPLRCCLSLSHQWSANSDLLLWLWDYFHKRMNDSFHLPGQSLNSYAVLSSSALQWMEQCKSRVSSESIPNMEDESSFSLFLRVVSLHLTKLLQSGSLRTWKQIKGRFYSKFHKRRMQELKSTGLHQFISLFLTLSCVADLEDVANKMCSLLELLDFNNMQQDKKICVWKGLFALLLIFKENNVDLSYLAEKLSQSFTTVARDYTEPSSLDKHQQRNCWQLISLYLDNTQDVFEHKNKKDLSESKLLGDGFQWLFRSCRDNELRYLLTFVQTTLTSITQRNRKETSSAVNAMWEHVFNHVRALMSDAQCMQSVSKHLADTLATFILSALDRYPDAVEGLPDVSFPSLVQELGTQDDLPASFVCRLLCHLLPCSVAVEAIQTERSESGVIHTWFRCLVQLPPSHENLTELTRAVAKLPEMETLLKNQPGFGSVENSDKSLQLFIKAIGDHFASLNTFDETIHFREKVQSYLGDFMKYTDHVLRNGGPEELLRVAYHVAGLLTKHCYKIIYSKTQPRCLLPRLVDQFALPLPNAKNPVPPLVMQCIKSSLHQFLQGLSCLDFKRDEFIRRKIKQVFTTYFRLFNQKYQAASHCGNATTKNPFLVVLKDSLSPNPTTEASDFRQFVVEVIRESFLCLPQPPANLTSTLFFLEHLLKRTVSPAETARNTPVLLNAITGCLLACNEFTSDREPAGIRRQASEILRMMLTACKSAPEVTSRDTLLSYLRDFLFTNLLRNHGLLFKTFESLACFDRDLLAKLIPAAKQAVVQSEQKRGVGTDKVLRSAFKLFLSRLGEKGEAEIKNLEEDSITSRAQ